MDIVDSVLGQFNIIDAVMSWVEFAFMPKSKRARHGRLNLVELSIPRADKMHEAGKRVVSLNEVIEYLGRFGVEAKRSGFDANDMRFRVRRNQAAWAATLLDVDSDGIPRLKHGRKAWADK